MKQINNRLFLSIFFFPVLLSSAFAQLTCSVTTTPSTCTANGALTAIAAGGSGNYNYQLSAANSSCLSQSILQSSPTFNALKPCTYTVTVNDLVSGVQCQSTITLSGNYVLPSLNLQVTNCKIISLLTGGNDPFTYSYSTSSVNGPFTPNNPSTKSFFNGLPNGNVWIQVQDSCGNAFTQQATIGNNPISGFSYTFTNNTMTINNVTGGNTPYTYRVITNTGNVTNNTGIFTGVNIDCNTRLVVSDSCTTRTISYNTPPDISIACTNFSGGTASLDISGGVPPYTYQTLVNNVIVGTSTTGNFVGLPTTPTVKKYDFKVIDACARSRTVSIEAVNPRFSGNANCGPGGSLNVQVVRGNNTNSSLFYPIQVNSPTSSPTNYTYNSPNNSTVFTNLSGNPNIFTFENACGDKINCKDTLILNLTSNCVNISAAMRKLFICDNGTTNEEVPLVGAVTYTLTDANGNVIASNTSGVFTATGAGTFTINATHANCGTLVRTITISPGTTQINPSIEVMIRYRAVNGKCVPRYTLKIPIAEGPYFLSGSNNINQFINTPNSSFYYATDIPPGTYTLTSTTFCTGVPINLPTPVYNMTAMVTQTCPGDAQVQLTGAKDFAYWKNWFATNHNLNLITWYNNGGPHKDFYTLNLSNNYTGRTGEPYTYTNLNANATYPIYIYPFDARETGAGCAVDTAIVNIPAYNQLLVNASRGIICDGQSTTDIKVWVKPISNTNLKASGKKPYTYQRVSCQNLTTPIGTPINTPDTSVIFNGLNQGTHCFKVLDACNVSADFQSEAGPLGAGQYIAVNCGQLRLQVDTIPGATYQWKNITTGQILSNQYFTLVPTPNSQTSFVCDINIGSCQMQRSVTIPPGVGLVKVSINPNGATDVCQGQNVTLNAVGNANTYLWNTGQAGTTIQATSSGLYRVTATNLLGCKDTASIPITVYPKVKASIITKNISCFAQNDGQVEIVNPDNPNIFYQWSNGATSPKITNLAPNNYTLTITDIHDCKTTFDALITQPQQLIASINNNDVTCFGNNDGLAQAVVNGGTMPYNYQWSNGAKNDIITNLNPGNYSLSISDNNGCIANSASIINEPNPLIININPSIPTVCIGESTPVTVIIQGGNNGFSFLWSNGATTPTQTLPKGKYSVSVTDNKGCKANKNFDIIETTTVAIPFLNNMSLCEGTNKTLTINGNFKTYQWSTGTTTSSININEAKQFCVSVTTQGGCKGDTCIEITQVPNPQPIIQGDTLICREAKTNLGLNKAFAKYQWSNQATTAKNSVGIGNYQVTVTDNNGCVGIDDVNVKARLAPKIDITPSKKLCEKDSVLLKINADAIDYAWNNSKKGDAIFVSKQGKYCITVTDKFNCKNDTCIEIISYPLPVPRIVGDSLFCKNENTTLQCVDNFVSYQWSNQANTKNITTSKSGIYTITVTDINGCNGMTDFKTDTLSIPQFEIVGDTSFCAGKKITLRIDRKMPFYQWSNNSNTDSIVIDKGGIYQLLVRDSSGCKNQTDINILERPLPNPKIVGNPAICSNKTTTLSLSQNYSNYEWSNGSKEKSITISLSDIYKVTVTDQYQCSNVTEQITKTIAALKPVIIGQSQFCEGQASTLRLDSIYEKYLWSNNGEKMATIEVKKQGNYCITVSDSNGCDGDTCINIIVNPLPKAKIEGKTLICGNKMTTLRATPSIYNYRWQNGDTTQTVTVNPGKYTVKFNDNNGCQDSVSTTVNAAPEVAFLAKAILKNNDLHVSCNGLNDGSAELEISRGTPPFKYQWSNNNSGIRIENLKAGKYQITVIDALGCVREDSVILRQPEALRFWLSSKDTKCHAEKNGLLIIDSISGGNEKKSYSFENQSFKSIKSLPLRIENLPQGEYKIRIKDNMNCEATQEININTPSKLELTISQIDTLVKGDSIKLMPNYGFVPDSVQWSGQNLSCMLCQTPFYKADKPQTTVALRAWKNGCSTTAALTLLARTYKRHQIYIPNVFSPNGDNINDVFSVIDNPTVELIESLEIYDRWGERVWIGRNFKDGRLGWDGSFHGAPMNSAVFVYVAKVLFKDGIREIFKGDVTLLR